MEKIKNLKLNITFTALLVVLLGIVLLVWPENVLDVLAKVIAAVIVIIGVLQLIGSLMDENRRALGIVVAAIVIIVGGFLFINPNVLTTIVPIIFGVLLVTHGVQDVSLAFAGRKAKADKWVGIVVLAVLSILLGAFCIMNAFGIVKFTFRLIGIMLIYDGLSDMFIVHRVNKAERGVVDGKVLHETDVE